MAADRWGRRRVIVSGFIVLAIGDLAFLGANSYATFLFAALILGLGDFFSSSQTAILTDSVPVEWRSRALAGYRFCVDLGATIGPLLLAGLLEATGFETMVLIASTLLLIAAAGGLLGAQAARPVLDTPTAPQRAELSRPTV
jgi:DHA2 family multidrug resistance protein-like MFS transporter